MKNNIFNITKEMCNKCWKQFVKILKELKINNPQKINNLILFKYHEKKQIDTIATKVIATTKCNDNFYTVFWKEYLVTSNNSIRINKVKEKYVLEELNMNEQLINDIIFGLIRNKNYWYNLNKELNTRRLVKDNKFLLSDDIPVSFLPIPVSNEELLEVGNVKPKIQYWVWIMVVICILLLTIGVGMIGYEMHRRSQNFNIIFDKAIKDKKLIKDKKIKEGLIEPNILIK